MNRFDSRAAGQMARIALTAALMSTAVPALHAHPNENEEQPQADGTYLDEVTVTSTQTEITLRDAPGTVSVITDDEIEDRLIESIADLVKFEPGVYVVNDVTRLGLNGFNIRGIGGNRVLTQVDGVRSAEQFDFGPFNVHQQSIDLDALKSVEIVRSAGSALYGSDALGGVVSLLTKDPSDYLGSSSRYLGAKVGYDGRAEEASLNLASAINWEDWGFSLFLSRTDGSEFDNQGDVGGEGLDRTEPNPQDREGLQVLAKGELDPADGNTLRSVLELNSTEAQTDALSSRGATAFGPINIVTGDVQANDEQDRLRLGFGQTLVDRAGIDLLTWDLYGQNVETTQVLVEQRAVSAFGPPRLSERTGNLDFEQFTLSGDVRGRKQLGLGATGAATLSFGVSYVTDEFDTLRDRVEIDSITGATIPQSLIFPTKYFPTTDTTELGAYVQTELSWDRVTIIPGVRYDNYEVDADETDRIYLESGGLPPADFDDDSFSPKLGVVAQVTSNLTVTAQYAAGFRAPPYSAINTGFTNLAGGYLTLANPGLEPETSDNFELGLRGTFGRTSWSVTGFQNQYEDFIDLVVVGFDPFLNAIEFQNVNLSEVEIEGFELRAESRIGDNFLVRFAYADIEGNDVTGDIDVPLSSIAPNEGSLGLRYFADSGRWGLDGSLRVAESASQETAGEGGFAPDGYEVVDLIAFFELPRGLALRVGLMNATDETYFPWWNVRGRSASDPRIDLYSSPGRNVVATLGWSW